VVRCRVDLAAAEEALRDFQRQNRAVQIDAQTEGAIKLAAELQGRIMAAEVELQMLRQRALPTAPEVRFKEQEIAALKAQFVGLGGGTTQAPLRPGDDSESVFPRFEAVPDMALQYVRLMRNLKVQETLHALLVQQLEQSRIEELKNTPVLSVLDWAEPGERPVYPRKMLFVAIAALVAAVWVAIVAVAVETLRARRASQAEAQATAALAEEWQRTPGWVRRLERFVVR
jgi:capsule polysaccharide export protein KpsE/RkpR